MPAQITTAWTITRTSLSLPTLTLASTASFVPDVTGVARWVPKSKPDLGAVGWRQTLVGSPYVGGKVEVHAVPEIVKAKFACQIEAQDYPTLIARETECIQAFQQASYTLAWTSSDGGSESWSCLRATVQKVWDEMWSFSLVTTLLFDFLRQPAPLTGGY